MEKLKPIGKGDHLVGYASSLAHLLFDGIIRDMGLPYTQAHLAEVAKLVAYVTAPSGFQDAAVATAWLHDSAEDIKGLDVFDPFDASKAERKEDVVYLNDLLAEAGDEGKAVCFMVNLMTHRVEKGIIYPEYVQNIFSFPKAQPQRDLHILTGIIKMADRRMNINPDERRNINKLVKEYISLEGADKKTFEEFYRKTKIIDAFTRKGEITSLDIGLFSETLRNAFMEKQRAVAIDNISFYLPLAEKKLLVDIGEKNNLFHWENVRKMLKETYIDSLRIYPGGIHEVKLLGINRTAPEIPGYTSILKEIREERAKGAY